MKASSSRSVLYRILRDPVLIISGLVFLLIVLSCLFAPILTKESYIAIHVDNILAPMSLSHPFGTDGLGRDLFARVLYGGRVTFGITFLAVAVSLIGIILGLFSGYFGGVMDDVLSRIFDALSVLPPLLLIVIAQTIVGYGEGFHYALGVAFMPSLFRLTRTLTQETAGKDYIDAAKVLGVKAPVILFKHIFRNILPELLTQIVSTFSDILLYCTLIGYLSMGVNPPTPEWGLIVHDMFSYVLTKPLLLILVSGIVSLTILSINLFGRGLRDAFSMDRRTE